MMLALSPLLKNDAMGLFMLVFVSVGGAWMVAADWVTISANRSKKRRLTRRIIMMVRYLRDI